MKLLLITGTDIFQVFILYIQINFNMEKKLKNVQTFEQHTDKNLNISDVSCRCSIIKEISIKRVKELQGLKKYARDQFTIGLIESQIKYWYELQ